MLTHLVQASFIQPGDIVKHDGQNWIVRGIDKDPTNPPTYTFHAHDIDGKQATIPAGELVTILL